MSNNFLNPIKIKKILSLKNQNLFKFKIQKISKFKKFKNFIEKCQVFNELKLFNKKVI